MSQLHWKYCQKLLEWWTARMRLLQVECGLWLCLRSSVTWRTEAYLPRRLWSALPAACWALSRTKPRSPEDSRAFLERIPFLLWSVCSWGINEGPGVSWCPSSKILRKVSFYQLDVLKKASLFVVIKPNTSQGKCSTGVKRIIGLSHQRILMYFSGYNWKSFPKISMLWHTLWQTLNPVITLLRSITLRNRGPQGCCHVSQRDTLCL